jgi:uncharacterized protein (TIGR02453 family)
MNNRVKFSGFPEDCINFLIDLEENNNRKWFKEHRNIYDKFVLEPARDFVVAMGKRLMEISPHIIADPRVDKSIFRIYRDTRFSKDKTPYKTNLAIWFWEGKRPRMENSGFYFHIEPDLLFLGAGLYKFPPDLLEIYRKSVVHPEFGNELVDAIEMVEKASPYNIGVKHYKRIPKGYDANHQNAEYLLYNGMSTSIELNLPEEVFKPEIVDFCYQKFIDMSPVYFWVRDMIKRG